MSRNVGLLSVVCLFLLLGASGNNGGSTSPLATSAPLAQAAGDCAVPIETANAAPRVETARKPAGGSDARSRRARVYQELWKHQAAAQARARTRQVSPTAVPEDIGQISVVRDQGDIILPANPFDLQGAAVSFVRNGVGAFDVRKSTRTFQSSVGDKITLGDDASAHLTLPFSFPYYAARYSDAFLNSDGNVTFVEEEHASTDRDVARFLGGPPRIAPLFDDLDPSNGGGVYQRADGDALVITWCNVPEFDLPNSRVTVQLRLAADGTIDFLYGSVVVPTGAVVGVSPGETGIFTPIDVSAVSASSTSGGTGAVGERFAASPEIDFVALGKTFYQGHADDFDQLVVFTNTRVTRTGTFAFEFTVANEVSGIGVDIYDASRDFGSRGRLRSMVNMGHLFRFPDDPRQRFLGENNTLSLLGQECGHRWLAFLRFRDGAVASSELLGRDEAHWSFFFDSDASNMEGNDIEDRGGGQFRTVGAVSRYSALDQYAMGLRPASEVPSMFLVTKVTSGGSAEDPPRIGVDIRGTRKDVRIEDIVAAMGPRRPDAATAPKTFRQAFIYVVTQTPETTDDLNRLERIRGAWETYFNDSTDGRGTLIARLR